MRITRLLIKGAIVLIIPVFLIVILRIEKSPEKEIAAARLAISEARAANAGIYSAKMLTDAISNYNSAMQYWQKENSRLIIFRDYKEVKLFAINSFEKAKLARDKSIVLSADFVESLKARLTSTRVLINHNQEIFLKLPENSSLRKENSRGRLIFAEAERAFKVGQYSLCDDKLRESNYYLASSYGEAREMLEEYFKMWPQWIDWVKGAVQTSRKRGTNTIVIDKFARRCYVYSNGSLIIDYSVDLGRNWIGDKREDGDKATPEGIYRITAMKKGAQTGFYKAMLIDYPNADDKARFNREKKIGLLHKKAEIGGLIEIHGKGGTGTDWTDGCIALTNSDMDKLFSLCSIGTMVAIVGSVKELNEILKPQN